MGFTKVDYIMISWILFAQSDTVSMRKRDRGYIVINDKTNVVINDHTMEEKDGRTKPYELSDTLSKEQPWQKRQSSHRRYTTKWRGIMTPHRRAITQEPIKRS